MRITHLEATIIQPHSHKKHKQHALPHITRINTVYIWQNLLPCSNMLKKRRRICILLLCIMCEVFISHLCSLSVFIITILFISFFWFFFPYLLLYLAHVLLSERHNEMHRVVGVVLAVVANQRALRSLAHRKAVEEFLETICSKIKLEEK